MDRDLRQDNFIDSFKKKCSLREIAELVIMSNRLESVNKQADEISEKLAAIHEEQKKIRKSIPILNPKVKFEEASVEHKRLFDSENRLDDWKNFGPYLSERAWGTVREDYSPDGNAWSSFPHDHARSRTFRWNEDGIAGICNRYQNICLSLAFWNEKDPIIKERLFGLTGDEGNKGEDVKELYYYLDSTPTHSYMKYLYKYPQEEYPYTRLVRENASRSRLEPECELIDLLPNMLPPSSKYFDCEMEWVKHTSDDLSCKITIHNRGTEDAPIHVLPQCWFRNTWSWGYTSKSGNARSTDLDGYQPVLSKVGEFGLGMVEQENNQGPQILKQQSPFCAAGDFAYVGKRYFYAGDENFQAPHDILFCDNETNSEKIWGTKNKSKYPKDGINDYVVGASCKLCAKQTNLEHVSTVNPEKQGSKCAAHFRKVIPAGRSAVFYIRLSPTSLEEPFQDIESVVAKRKEECDAFYQTIVSPSSTNEEKQIQRQALAGMLWSKQFYHFAIDTWLRGDPSNIKPPASRITGRNSDWRHLFNRDVISMPDKWEYPWYAAWDLAFHTIALVLVDPEWAKRQLILMLREWYMHPNGQIPAYEWNFSDVNPPVHAWACYRVYKIASIQQNTTDISFLERCFHKLLLNFTWWVNRKDANGSNLFDGGFLGLDNIGIFDRSNLDEGWKLEQADSTAWMACYCLDMLRIAIELALVNPSYEDVCSKFMEHFVAIASTIRRNLWDEETGFFYDKLIHETGETHLKYRSFVGLLTMLPCMNITEANFDRLPNFKRRTTWFLEHRAGASDIICYRQQVNSNTGIVTGKYLFSILSRKELESVLKRCFNENEFLSPFGLRSLSKEHDENPYRYVKSDGTVLEIGYEPGESRTNMYGGNSNWRGPIWMPTNFAIVESLQRYDFFYDETFVIEFPTNSKEYFTIGECATLLTERLISLFRKNGTNQIRPIHGPEEQNYPLSTDEHFQDLLLFYEYFDGETGKGLGASHQTGWTGLVAKLIQTIRIVE